MGIRYRDEILSLMVYALFLATLAGGMVLASIIWFSR